MKADLLLLKNVLIPDDVMLLDLIAYHEALKKELDKEKEQRG